MGERVTVEEFLAELENDFDESATAVGAGHPAEFDIRRALIAQRKAYVLGRFRKLFAGQKYVNLPDAVDPTDKNQYVWRREDWDQVAEDVRDW